MIGNYIMGMDLTGKDWPPIRKRRKFGTLRSTYLHILISTRSPEQVVQWLKTWLKAGKKGQYAMEERLYRDNKLV